MRDVIHDRAIKNKEALANPEALDLYRDLAELRSWFGMLAAETNI